MDSEDGFSSSGSRLFSEPPLSPWPSSDSHAATDDLSISELSLSNRPDPVKPFSLLARPPSIAADDTFRQDTELIDEEAEEKQGQFQHRTREEKLQNDLFILKKLNATFMLYKDALMQTQSATARVVAQLQQTDSLLDKYSNVLEKSEAVTKLIFDERWEGADVDDEILLREALEERERRRREKEEEERLLAAQKEKERIRREEQQLKERKEKDALERERKGKSIPSSRVSGVRGVRGTRASMRGMSRSSAAASSTSVRSRSSSINPHSSLPSDNASKRPVSSASLRPPSVMSRPSTRMS